MSLFTLEAKIGLDTREYDKGISKSKSSMGDLSAWTVAKGKLMADAIEKGLQVVSKAGQQLIGEATKNYAAYEQLVGGVETLFGAGGQSLEEYAKSVGKTVQEAESEYGTLMQSQQAVLDHAAEAYRTAGMSANDYMETVTASSAALLQSLGGDTVAAAELADQAIIDMSDNANKMGSDIESIKVAYAGFAKGNMTMLDNLKLGYGGTREEMQRLLDDANRYNAAQGKFTDYQIDNYADIVQAINTVQTEMGITGTTSKEASTTIEGSVSAMKAAWTNLSTGIADDNADIEVLVDEFVESASTAAQNIVPRIQTALEGAGKMVEEITPVIIQQIPDIIEEMLPKMVESGVNIITKILEGFQQDPEAVVSTVGTVIGVLIDAVIDLFPKIISTGADLLITFINEIANHPGEVISTAMDLISILAGGLIEAFPDIIRAAGEMIAAFIDEIVNNWPEIKEQGVELLKRIIEGIGDTIQAVADAAQSVVDAIIEGIQKKWGELTEWFNGIWEDLFGRREVDVTVNKDVNTTTTETTVVETRYETSGNPNAAPARGDNNAVAFDGSHAGGLDYVPFDGYIAQLHKGERVLTAQEARSGAGMTFGNVSINIDGGQYGSPDAIAAAVAEALQNLSDRRSAVYA